MKFLPRLSTFDNVFDNMFPDSFFQNTNTYMKTDVREVDNNYVLDMEIPGFKKEDILLELNQGYLTVTANRNEHHDQKDDNGNIIRQERFTGSCSRSFYVGDNVKESDIKASYNNGELKIILPKIENQVEMKQYIPIE